MLILAIDPGPKQSAYIRMTMYPGDSLPDIEAFNIIPNETLLTLLDYGIVVIEKVANMGMPVGAEVFETVYWTGRFAQRVIPLGGRVYRIERVKVKHQLCGTHRAKDANVRQAIINRFGGSAAIRKGGALYKISSHVWSALAVGLTWIETYKTVDYG